MVQESTQILSNFLCLVSLVLSLQVESFIVSVTTLFKKKIVAATTNGFLRRRKLPSSLNKLHTSKNPNQWGIFFFYWVK